MDVNSIQTSGGYSPPLSIQQSDILCLTGADHQESMPVWEIMSPKEFYTFTIPFEIQGPTTVRISKKHLFVHAINFL